MPVTDEYCEFVLEQLDGLGNLRSRRMFGGVGLYCDNLFFALIADDTLYLKVDDSNRPDFEERGMPPFVPYPDRSDASMGYCQVPAEVLEDNEDLVRWAARSVKVAARKSKTSKRRPSC